MKKISEYIDEEALDLLAELIEPAAIIMADKAIAEAMKGGNRMSAISTAIKNHKPEVMRIMAVMDGVPVEEYHCDVFTLPMRVLDLLNDKALLSFFSSQAPETSQKTSSGPVMGTTEGSET